MKINAFGSDSINGAWPSHPEPPINYGRDPSSLRSNDLFLGRVLGRCCAVRTLLIVSPR